MNKTKPNCPGNRPLLCCEHIDWKVIETAENDGHKMAPIFVFRHPIPRVVSHFYFSKSRVGGKPILNQTLTQYLDDVDHMMKPHLYQIWHDGQVSIQSF